MLDTNVLIDYLFEFTDRHKQAMELIRNLKEKGYSIYVPYSVKNELLKIIAESFIILRDLIISKMKENNWDELFVENKMELLDEIKQNFYQLFENRRYRLYPNTTRKNYHNTDREIRPLLANKIFSKLRNELICKRLSEIQNEIMSENRIKDLEEYITKKLEGEFLKFPEEIGISFSSYEEEMKHIIYLRTFGKIKNFGLNDMSIFSEVYHEVSEGVCDNITIISKDQDLAVIKESELNELEEFIKNSKNPERKKYAEEIRDLIRYNIKVENLEDVLKKLNSSH
ncbi:MAG: type II toxin-antitoxin system VapC family toxin [Candidatus Aramenus sp.]|nr:type II toxin-antitoxin system VapC family toxin [Candidatus Aramenus sp.]